MDSIEVTSESPKKTVEFVDQQNSAVAEKDVPSESPAIIRKKKREPEHKHELVVLDHLVKRRLRRLIRQLQNHKYALHLKRQYKRSARERKLFRRSEYDRKKKAAEKAALKKAGKGGEKWAKDDSKKAAGKPSKKDDEAPKKLGDKFRPLKRHQKWRENKYRKWRKHRLRARFTKQEESARKFATLYPGTRPFSRPNFGWSKSEEMVRVIHRSRLSARWSETMYPSGDSRLLRPVPKVNPNMRQISGRNQKETKGKLTKLLKDDWELSNYDRLQKEELVKGMAALILQAKERYDLERRRSQLALSLEEIPVEDVPTEDELESKINKQLESKIQRLLSSSPSERLKKVEARLLPQILRDKQIRRNTFINRPKTSYDCYLRRKLTTQTLQKYLQQRHLLSATETPKETGAGDQKTGPRMPLPYRRVVIGSVRPVKIFLPNTRLFPAQSRRGPPPTQPMTSIFPADYIPAKVAKLKEKRPKYPKQQDPHNPEKLQPKPPKIKKTDKDKKGATEPKPKKAPPAGKKGKTPVRRGPPPKGTKAYKEWHRKQKRQRRKRKRRNWIIMAETRRRIQITQEILQEEHFKAKHDLPAMRKKIRQLEQQAKKANTLVAYLSGRNEYLKDQFSNVYTRKHSEYHGAYTDWRTETDQWFKLRDEIDKVNDDMHAKAAAFLVKCQAIIDATQELEERLQKDVANLQTNYTNIVQFIRHEPIWQAEIEDLLTKTRYYDFLYTFREAREEGSLTMISDLLQRRMHKDFMNMAYQERRKMRRQLPNACKNMLDERGLLAQELNKISIWCNRLPRRKEKLILPEIGELQQKQDTLRRKIHSQVARRQPVILQSRRIRRRLKGYSLAWPRKTTSFQRLDTAGARTNRKVDKSEFILNEEVQEHSRKAAAVEALKSHIASLHGMVTRDYHQRRVNCQVTSKVAHALKKAFGVPEDYNNVHWPAKGAVQNGLPSDPNGMVMHLLNVLEITKASTSKAFIVPAKDPSPERRNLFRSVPVSLQKFST